MWNINIAEKNMEQYRVSFVWSISWSADNCGEKKNIFD